MPAFKATALKSFTHEETAIAAHRRCGQRLHFEAGGFGRYWSRWVWIPGAQAFRGFANKSLNFICSPYSVEKDAFRAAATVPSIKGAAGASG